MNERACSSRDMSTRPAESRTMARGIRIRAVAIIRAISHDGTFA